MLTKIARTLKVDTYNIVKLYDAAAARTLMLSSLPFVPQKARARACKIYIRAKVREEGKEALIRFIAEVPSEVLKNPQLVSIIAEEIYQTLSYEEANDRLVPILNDRIKNLKSLNEKQKLYICLMLGAHDIARTYIGNIADLRKPDFVIAGAQKAGTTWLRKAVSNHPDVWVPPIELHYFTSNRLRWSWEEYLALFSLNDKKFVGEKSTTYLQSIEEVTEKLPETQVFVVLRDPFDRLVSHYLHSTRNGQYEDGQKIHNIRDFIERNIGNCLGRGLYYKNLRNSFSKVNVLFFQDLLSDPKAFLIPVLSSLGLTDVNPDQLVPKRKINSSNNRPTASYKDFLKAEGVAGTLREYYLDDITQLSRATGRDLSEWIEW